MVFSEPLPHLARNERAWISRLLAVRHVKHRFLAADLFNNPCWNMILDLAVAEHDGRAVSVTSLCLASGVPVTTALRHLEKLVERGYLIRRRDKKDRRRILVSLTDDARRRLKRSLRELSRLEFLSAQRRDHHVRQTLPQLET